MKIEQQILVGKGLILYALAILALLLAIHIWWSRATTLAELEAAGVAVGSEIVQQVRLRGLLAAGGTLLVAAVLAGAASFYFKRALSIGAAPKPEPHQAQVQPETKAPSRSGPCEAPLPGSSKLCNKAHGHAGHHGLIGS